MRGPARQARAYPVADPVEYLTGRWELKRRIADAAGGVQGWFEGIARFTPDRDGLGHRELDYVEEGVLRYGSCRGPAGRALRYRPAGPGRVAVEFPDGGAFHDLDLRTGRWSTRHSCGPDDYHGEFIALSWERWRQMWRVTGPDKRLLLETDYYRTAPY